MPRNETPQKVGPERQRRIDIDEHYTLAELEWNRLVGPSGLAARIVGAMAALGTDVFNFEFVGRIPSGEGERLEFVVEGETDVVRLDYDRSYTSTLLQGVRYLFGEINGALRRRGLPYRYVLERDSAAGPAVDYRLVLARRADLTDATRGRKIVAGLEIRDYEMG